MAIVYNAGTGAWKNWLVQEDAFDVRCLGKCEAIFAQGNGYLGVRNALEEAYTGEKRNMFVTGTFNKASEEEVTELPNVPDMTGITLKINGYALNLVSGCLESYNRTLNLKTGESVRSITWKTPEGITVAAVFKRMVSLCDEHVFAGSLEFSLDRQAEVILETGVDGSVTNSGAQHFDSIKRRVYDAKDMQYLSRTTQSGVWIAQHAACRLDKDVAPLPVVGRRTLKQQYRFLADAGETVHFEKICTVHSSRDMAYEGMQQEIFPNALQEDGRKALQHAYEKGYAALLCESAKVWEDYWKESDIIIEGDADFDQLAVRFALYHLNIMVKHDDNRVGIGAKALTGEGYKGHSFWDTEMFILPYYTFTKPGTARTLLEYRYKNLYGARAKAKEYGYEGAMYPWESAWVDDGEVTPLYEGIDVVTGEVTKILTGMIEHHITADIAYAVAQYAQVTGDTEYMETCGYEIILDTALFWASRVQYVQSNGRYEILDVIGPDEYKEHVDNNAYTNYMADYNMRLALAVMEELRAKRPAVYERLDQKLNLAHIREKIQTCIDKLYLPKLNEDGIVPQSDQFLQLKQLDLSKYKNNSEVMTIYRDINMEQLNQYMVSKQADTVMLLLLFDNLFDEAARRKNFLFYEDKTLHDSSLSKSTHAIVANDLGMYDIAYQFYERALVIDLGGSMHSSDAGVHSASLGGVWESTVMGFGGVRIHNGLLRIAPKLPDAWSSMCFPLCYLGCRLKVTAGQQKVQVENQGGKDVALYIGNEQVTIAAGTKIEKEYGQAAITAGVQTEKEYGQ